MIKALILFAVISLAAASKGFMATDATYNLVADEHINYINSVQNQWTAGINSRFLGMDKQSIKSMLGAFKGTPNNLKLPVKTLEEPTAFPENFDSRDAWPNCESIKEVRDQSTCGSCWAFGAVETMSDRICIHSNQTLQTRISAENLLACCDSCGDGCQGGFPAAAFQYWKDTGIVTGSLNNVTDKWCQPYSLPACDHHVNGTLKPCPPGVESPTPACSNKCANGLDYNKDLHYASEVYSVSSRENQIKAEIMNHGPVEAAFSVYADFLNYKTGVYQYVSGEALGGHAIKIIGWGVQNGTPYWTVVNSWNQDWGNKGLFLIRRGNNECGIEDEIVAGIPKL